MKKYFFFFLFAMILLPLSVFSQSDREDVIYLKNGSTYRGTITEQIPNVSYKIEIAGGSVIVINAADVTKITKEPKYISEPEYHHRTKQVYEFHYRPKGYFFQAQVETEALEFGFRIVNGYKFGQFGYLGLGLGVDGMILDLHGNTDYGGPYIPIYVYYSGDILQKQITPFYTVEAGYAFGPTPTLSPGAIFGNSNITGGSGGVMAGVGFGVRFFSKRKVHFDLSAHFDIKQSSTTFHDYNNNIGYQYNYTEHTILLIPGLRFGLGF